MSITKKASLIHIAPQYTLSGFNFPLLADLNNDGYLDYLTTTAEIGSSTGEPVKLYLSNAQGTYTDSSNLILENFTSLWTQKILAADLNNDGLQDIILGAAPEQGNSRTDGGTGTNTVNASNWGCPQYVLFQNRDGTFSPVQTIATTYEAHSINVSDFNNDGLKDILYVSDIYGQTPRLLLNTGRNSFTNADLSNIIGSGVAANSFKTFYATTGDFNNDSNQDIVFLQGGYQNGAYTFIALGDGKGGFTRGAQLPMVPENMGGEAATEEGDAVLDLNHDGYLDLMVWVIDRRDVGLGDLSPGHLQILINNGLGQFIDQTTQWLGDFATTSIGATTRSLQSYIPGTHLIPLNIYFPLKGSSNGYLQEPIFLYNTGSQLLPIYDPYWNQELLNGNGFILAGIQWRLENGKITAVYDDWNVNLVSVTLNPADEPSYYKSHDPFVEINQDARLASLNDGYAFSTAFYQPWYYSAMPSYVQNMQRQLLENTPGNRILIGTKDNDFISVGNAFAGTGNNVLIGNGGNNVLMGGTGDDIFIPSGTSYIVGGGGNDTVVLNQNQSAYKATQSGEVYTATYGSTTYTFEGISYVRFVDKTLNLTTQVESTNSPLLNINYINESSSILNVPNTTYIGNDGSNTLIINARFADFSISETGSVKTLVDTAGNLGKEFLINIEKLQFTDQIVVIGVLSIEGTSTKDKLLGTTDDDEIYGYAGNDSLTSLAGNDTLDGGTGNDTLIGGLGDDTYYVDAAKDVATEKSNQGTDSVISTATAVLANNVENLTLSGSSAINATGNTANNTVTGNSANNSINGGLGNDTLTGDSGNDTFVFNTKLGATNVDTITDFAAGDKIALSGSIFSKLKGDKDLSDNFVLASATTTKQYLIYNPATGKLYYDADGSAAKSSPIEVAIIGIDSHATLTASDFLIV